jgi:hypothetical protein
MKIVFIIIFIALTLGGCATDPMQVTAIKPSNDIYADRSCNDLIYECKIEMQNVIIYTLRQQIKRDRDAARIGAIPIFDFWELGDDKDNTTNLQVSMGRYEAACKRNYDLGCGYRCEPVYQIIQNQSRYRYR